MTDLPADGDRPSAIKGAGLGRNSLYNLLGLGAPLLVGLAAMPPVVRGLGPERFGILGLVWVALAYLSLLDLGLSRATTRFAATALARGEVRELRGLATVAATTQLAMALVGGGAVAVLAGPFVHRVLDLSAAHQAEAVGSFMTLAAAAPVLVVSNTFRGLLEAGHRFDLVNLIRGPTSAANFLVPLLGVWSGWSIVGIVLGVVVVRSLALVAYVTSCLRLWPVLRRPGFAKRGTARELLGFGGWVTVSSVISPLLVYVDRFLIGAVVSVGAVGYYTAPHEVVSRLAILPSSIAAALFPAFSAPAPTGRLGRLFARSTKYLVALIAPPLLCLALLSTDLLRLWLGPEFAAAGGPVLQWLALGMIMNGLAFLPYGLLQGRGRPDLTAKFHLLELPLYLVLLWGLLNRWGIEGAAAAWAIRVTLDAILLFGAVVRLGIIPGAALLEGRLPRTALSLLLAGLLGAAAVATMDGMWVRLAVVVTILLGWMIWAWSATMEADERMQLRQVLGLGRQPS